MQGNARVCLRGSIFTGGLFEFEPAILRIESGRSGAREECATTLLQGTAFEKNLKKGFCDVLSKFCVFFKI